MATVRDRAFFSRIGKRGGRPTWQETLAKHQQRTKGGRKRLPPVVADGTGALAGIQSRPVPLGTAGSMGTEARLLGAGTPLAIMRHGETIGFYIPAQKRSRKAELEASLKKYEAKAGK